MVEKKYSIRWLAVCAVLMAMNVALSSLGIPVPGGHLYLNDIVICTASIMLDPLGAFAVGGVGAFLGDLMTGYVEAMFTSLVSHGLQAIVISVCCRRLFRKSGRELPAAIVGVLLGAVVMVTGYTLGRAYIYRTPEYAIIKLPFEILQASLGVVAGPILCFPCGLKKAYERIKS